MHPQPSERARVRAILATAALLLLPLPASALTGSGQLGPGASTADLLRVTCFDDGSGAPASLVASVMDLAPSAAPLVSVQIRKGDAATNATDAVDADATPSPAVAIDGGAGTYDVFVDKSGDAAESYGLMLECRTGSGGSGVATGTLVPAWASAVPALPAGARLLLLALLALLGLRALDVAGRSRTQSSAGRTSALLIGVALAALPGRVSAHTQNGTLGSAASATDYYQVTCFDDGSGEPASVVVSILDAAPGALPLVSVQVQKDDALASISDTIDADASPSAEVPLSRGGGIYHVLVDKTGDGIKYYSLEYHCTTGTDGGGVHTGSAISVRQNQ